MWITNSVYLSPRKFLERPLANLQDYLDSIHSGRLNDCFRQILPPSPLGRVLTDDKWNQAVSSRPKGDAQSPEKRPSEA